MMASDWDSDYHEHRYLEALLDDELNDLYENGWRAPSPEFLRRKEQEREEADALLRKLGILRTAEAARERPVERGRCPPTMAECSRLVARGGPCGVWAPPSIVAKGIGPASRCRTRGVVKRRTQW